MNKIWSNVKKFWQWLVHDIPRWPSQEDLKALEAEASSVVEKAKELAVEGKDFVVKEFEKAEDIVKGNYQRLGKELADRVPPLPPPGLLVNARPEPPTFTKKEVNNEELIFPPKKKVAKKKAPKNKAAKKKSSPKKSPKKKSKK